MTTTNEQSSREQELRGLLREWQQAYNRMDDVGVSVADFQSLRRRTHEALSSPIAITAEEAGREGDGWLPIETAPKDGTYILLSCDGGVGSWVGRFQQFAVSGYKFNDPWRTMMLDHDHMPRATRYHAPTHWQPLPSAPAQSGGQGNG